MPAVHPNYIKASNLTLVTLILGIINIFLGNTPLNNIQTIATLIFTIGFTIVLAYFIRQGYPWMKIVLLVLSITGTLIIIPIWLRMVKDEPIVFIINIIQTAIQIWVIILLFKIPKPITVIEKGPDLSEPL